MTWLVAEVTEIVEVTASARAITLRVPGFRGALAGQHVDLRLTADDGYQAVRSYSLADTALDDVVELAVDRVDDGEVSPYLVDVLEVGDQMEVRGPLGGFFVWRPENVEPVQLIAGGSGIVPLAAMVRARRRAASTAPFRLTYSVRSVADAFFAEELSASAGVDTTWVYTREPPPGHARPAGRLAPADLASTFGPSQDPAVFVCGPTGFVEAAAALLLDAGHDAARIRTERFGGA
ncbi:FAD-binding oxidoreductase [Paraoerskovia marina]|uniref:Ferredoxin-NADP reductase n=1 Tax=Paraoerskovia marina TaxID=545619 RepID=A0A1H1MPP0_9CELL|nr:FAD-binding oxidoreductase [Paraoerskovia marina]SDR88716.1 Ferredoxin-NADP reductase [Paraoerskovia marina]